MDRFTTLALLSIAGMGLLFYTVEKLSRRWLGVKKGVSFVSRSVNDTHRKIDWTLRALFIFGLLFGGIVFSAVRYDSTAWFYIFLGYIVTTNFILELIRAFFQKKYGDEKNEYKVTLIQLCMLLLFAIVILSTEFFGLIPLDGSRDQAAGYVVSWQFETESD
ncbi:DUF4181 domain-containing protein [Sporosarcina sp. NCCP-2716]|uniref:DUF4181 domain-containing protein n=1 Tax=Sporosarcina sp. NCCP-2716 TaxID=2943679 RepID=UPI00203A4FA8|nr:DUF4181 domain-containing protein [Sporosarcina sp. NCCP-2716]